MQPPDKDPRVYDYIIMGCGISALTAAKLLSEQHSVLILERYNEPGGNHKSYTIDGMEFDIGAICFNTNDEQFRHFPELLRECVEKDVHVKKICTTGAIGSYPFDWTAEASSLTFRQRISCAISLLMWRLRSQRNDSARSYAQSRIGDALYRRVGLDLYIKRLFGVDAGGIDYDFAMKRMQWLSRETSLRHRLGRMIRSRLGGNPAPGRTVVRPPGGFGAYYQKAICRLRENGVEFKFNEAAVKIETRPTCMEVETNVRMYSAKQIISTIPLDEASALCGLPETGLPTVTMLSLYVALRGTWVPDCSIFYNFHSDGNWKRITVHSHFYPSAAGYDKHFTVEITIPPGAALPDPSHAFSDLRTHLLKMKLIEGDLTLIGSSVLCNAYPIPEKGFKMRRDAAVAQLRSKGILCLGRQGKFEYIPHSNIAARETVATLSQASLLPPAADAEQRPPAAAVDSLRTSAPALPAFVAPEQNVQLP
ncbi:NAD(P)-binding protein [Rhizobium giardinii]|uniref:NAD(P)-binding protein n=1 Tax=Rhizobium giardinii TaxID=56731 RepID=UPI003D6F143D